MRRRLSAKQPEIGKSFRNYNCCKLNVYSVRISTEAQNGMVAQVLKDRLFNTPLGTTLPERSAVLAVQGIME